MQDGEIIELYFKRDEAAIKETDIKYGAYCHTVAMNILKDIFDAEECVNDTYHRAWQVIPPTRPTRLGAFLAKITRNIAIDRYKRDHAKKRVERESVLELSECVGEEPLNESGLSELGELISSFLKNERELCRRMFLRRYFFEDSIEKIAKDHSVSISQVKTTLHRMRGRLAVYLRREGVFIK